MKFLLTLALVTLLFNFGYAKNVPKNLKGAASDVIVQESLPENLEENLVDTVVNTLDAGLPLNTVNLLENNVAAPVLVENAPTKTVSKTVVSNAPVVAPVVAPVHQTVSTVSKTVTPQQVVYTQPQQVVYSQPQQVVRQVVAPQRVQYWNQPQQVVYTQPQTQQVVYSQPQTHQVVYSQPQQVVRQVVAPQRVQYWSQPQQQVVYKNVLPNPVVYNHVPRQSVNVVKTLGQSVLTTPQLAAPVLETAKSDVVLSQETVDYRK